MHEYWPRVIALGDMNAFFASIEQLDYPELRGRPVAVTNGMTGTTIITSSYEARSYGVKTGMRLGEARHLCPGLVQRGSRPKRYTEISTLIMEAIAENVCPDIEVFSIDEFFLDLTGSQSILGTPEQMADLIRKTVYEASGGLLCSVGIGGDKTTAKWAAKLKKPAGCTIINYQESEQRLAPVPVQDLCGIGKGIQRFLNEHGVYCCGDMEKIPISVLAKRFGTPGRRIWLMAQGKDPDPDPVHIGEVAAPKSIGHGKVIPPNTTDSGVIQMFMLHMAEKVASRLRDNNLEARNFWIGIRLADDWRGEVRSTVVPTQDGREIYRLCIEILDLFWQGQGVWQVQITAKDPVEAGNQVDLFTDTREADERRSLNQTIDALNHRFGSFTVSPATLLKRSEMPDVIAPSWKPSGHRKTI